MASEASLVLQSIRDELANHPPETVGALTLAEDVLSAYDGNLRLTAIVHHDPGAHPSVAHAHVIAEVGNGAQTARLDACVVGIDSQRQAALAGCGHSWVAAVAGPIFSLLHARPEMGASHFSGLEPWGVAGCHGFVGPLIGRLIEGEADLSPLQNAAIFDYVDALAPPGLFHLVKVTLDGTTQNWSRTIEIDGHEAVHVEHNWNAGLPTPIGVISQFAVFHFGDRLQAIEQRRSVDNAILSFVAAFEESGSNDKAAELLESRGFDPALVHDAESFVPIALGRAVFGDIGVRFSPDFMRINRDSTTSNLRLMRQPVYARATVLAHSIFAGKLVDAAKSLALTSPETRAINSSLHAGSLPQHLQLSRPVVAEYGIAQAELDKTIDQLRQRQSGEERATKVDKPWWRFW